MNQESRINLLFSAAKAGDADTIGDLFDVGVSPNLMDPESTDTPLMMVRTRCPC